MIRAQINRPCLGLFPPADWNTLVENSLGKAAPHGLTKVQTMACGSCANENAFKVWDAKIFFSRATIIIKGMNLMAPNLFVGPRLHVSSNDNNSG